MNNARLESEQMPQNNCIQNPIGVQLSLGDKFEVLLERYLHEPNTKINREIIRNNIESILLEARENAINEGKYYITHDREVYPTDLNPIVFVESDILDPTRISISFNYDGELLLEDIFGQEGE